VSLSLIVACAKDSQGRNVIGLNGKMPWHLPAELAYFKRVTMGKPIIMGRKTFDSIGRVLPGRRNIVVTHNRAWQHEGVKVVGLDVVYSIEDAMALVAVEEAFVIGGASLYKAALPVAHRVYLTEVHATIEGDTFFPKLETSDWHEISREHRAKDEKNAFDVDYVVYQHR
jgi:dihydrofolate reductase